MPVFVATDPCARVLAAWRQRVERSSYFLEIVRMAYYLIANRLGRA